MPLSLPHLDDRRYQDLVDELLARVPVHTPEWTNLSQADPGVTLVQLFAYLTETLLYRANQIPERNRKKFLDLLGLGLLPASAAEGLVTFRNERGPDGTLTLDAGTEVLAGRVPFRTRQALDVLPVDAHVCFKRSVAASEPGSEGLEYYRQLYATFLDAGQTGLPEELDLYEVTSLASIGTAGVDLDSDTVDRSLWVALLVRESIRLPSDEGEARKVRESVRRELRGKTLNLAVIPQIDADNLETRRSPGPLAEGGSPVVMRVRVPETAGQGRPDDPAQARYRTIASLPIPTEPEVYPVPLPSDEALLGTWEGLEPLEAGAEALPPSLEDTSLNERVVTWLKIECPAGSRLTVRWAGINTVDVLQRERVVGELLPLANGEPDQTYPLAHTSVLPETIRVTVQPPAEAAQTWERVEDLFHADPEVPTPSLRAHPGVVPSRATASAPLRNRVFALDSEPGRVRFGDGLRGARPPVGARVMVDYDFTSGGAGNLGADAIHSSPALPAGFTVTNPVRTWGGADAESVGEGEKHISRFLMHRDRLVSLADFESIPLRTPGVEIGRLEVIPAYLPVLGPTGAGNAPGAVTLMVIPRTSPNRPEAPTPDAPFLKAIADYLEPRRLVTTELVVRGPEYQPVYLSVGIQLVAGRNFAPAAVREAVKARLRRFLAPLRGERLDGDGLQAQAALLSTASAEGDDRGWRLNRPVMALELQAEVSRVEGVAFVRELFLGQLTGGAVDQVPIEGLQLPRLDGIEVTIGQAVDLASLRPSDGSALDTAGAGTGAAGAVAPRRVPVPFIPKEC